MKKNLLKLIVVLFAIVFALCGCGDETATAFCVNKIEVPKDELVFYMRRSSDVVVAKAEEEYGLDGTASGFWDEKMGETTPLEFLKETAKEEIVRSKVILLEAKKYGFKAPLTYSKQQEAWKKDNDDRSKKAEAGETLYGATLRSFYTYLSLISSEAESKLKTGLKEDEIIAVSDQEMKEYYATHPDYFTGDGGDFESNKQIIFNWILNEKFKEYLDDSVKNASIEDIAMTVDSDSLN